MSDYTKQMQEFASQLTETMKAAMPKVTVNKNGYEIRTQVLEMAQGQVWNDFHAKWGMYETSISKDGSELVTKVSVPEVPTADTVLDAAKKFYEFVNGQTK